MAVVGGKVDILNQTNRTQGLPGTGYQFLNAHFSRLGTEGKAHQLGDVKDGEMISCFISFLNLSLAAIEVGLAERADDCDRIGSCLLCLTENVI